MSLIFWRGACIFQNFEECFWIFSLFEEMVTTQGISVVAATHDSTLLAMANQVKEIRDGRIIEESIRSERFRS